MNVSALADPIQSADALFQQIRMEREIEAYEVLCKLKIAALTANFRADQRLRTTAFLGKVRGSAISLDQAQILVEGCAANTGFEMQKVLQRHRCFLVGTNHQHFFGAEIFQLLFQPLDPRVLFNPARFRVQCLRMQ